MTAGNVVSKSDLIFIVGRQRSGTTVLRDLVARAGALNCDEIFHGDMTRPYRFYGFVSELIRKDQRFVHPQNHAGAFWQYINHLRSEAAGRKIAMDVKYFGLNLIPQLEDVDSRTPFMFSFFRNTQAHVIHVVRKNKLRVFVSEEMSRQTGKWSAEKADHIVKEKPALNIDPTEALAFTMRQIAIDGRVASLMKDIPSASHINYEEMFDAAGNFSPATMQIAERVMGMPGLSNIPGNLKMNPEPLDVLVSNFSDLRATFSDTPYEWMLDAE